MKAFTAILEPVPHGGHYVMVPAKIVKELGLRHGARVRGTLGRARYRSSLMMYGGMFHLGVHKATLAEAGVKAPARVKLGIELDDEPLPTDTVPADLARALKRRRAAASAWKALRPSLKREHVKSVLDAKQRATRARRIDKIVASLVAPARARSRRR